jgi:hypothetical protein
MNHYRSEDAMPPGIKKKSVWDKTSTWMTASGITIVTVATFAVWAARTGEENVVKPYICKVISEEAPKLHAPIEGRLSAIESRLSNAENDTKIIRYIVEAGASKEVIRAAVDKARDSTFKVR